MSYSVIVRATVGSAYMTELVSHPQRIILDILTNYDILWRSEMWFEYYISEEAFERLGHKVLKDIVVGNRFIKKECNIERWL